MSYRRDGAVFAAHGYKLYSLNVTLRGGQKQTIYFFSAKRHQKRGTPSDLPPGYRVGVNRRTGLPFLKKVKKAGRRAGKAKAARRRKARPTRRKGKTMAKKTKKRTTKRKTKGKRKKK